MKVRPLNLQVSSDIGKVSAELISTENPKCIVTLAHGAGAGMNHDFMITISKLLAEKDIATLRFNFPFIENKKGRPDTPAVAQKTIEAAINKAQNLFPSIPLFLSGKSFGGRMSSQYLATEPSIDLKGIIFFGFPLHQTGKSSTERAEHLKSVRVPMLFLQGTKDALASFDLIEKVCSNLRLATLVKIEGANHAFKAGKKDIMPVLANAANNWIDMKIKEK